ncbi:hypothetical protein [Clostridium sp.]|nr:hypothetical protein [Clostridium sp.]
MNKNKMTKNVKTNKAIDNITEKTMNNTKTTSHDGSITKIK